MSTYQGSCLCGQVSYRIEGEQLAFYHCHCQRCRKSSGTGHASNVRISGGDLSWLSGEGNINSYRVPDAERFRNDFCNCCGSPLPRKFPDHGFIVVPAGTLDTALPEKVDARIFYGSRVEWSCEDGLPTFETYPE
ncbi:GFA family protein [Porticoccus sp. W117]|uniref:GFA family protein n=1 Tax=Porticoccus sp. W117 TaxID=3054777 RepID=UPI00259725A3|nr:GFA family protein [Porticoccus sp. W117]MDM3870906.1 GFA family protein [Porticoccus sp. W117]